MKKTIGFIGCGNMAQAMITGVVSSKIVSPVNVSVSDKDDEKLKCMKEKFNVNILNSNEEVAKNSDIIILAVKPNKYKEVIEEIKNYVKENVIIVIIGAGIAIEYVEKAFEKKVKVIRTMPNTPALVGEGMSAICCNELIEEEDLKVVVDIFKSFGKVEIIQENLMEVIPAVSGSSPAYVYMFIEALADGAVLDGVPRDKAYKMAAQSVLGAAKMVLETGEHPGVLKDRVCSPAGTTIEAVYSLEKNNFRGTVMEAMRKCTDKTREMSKTK
ncbi:pyrroline-5-carboxylate reductase [Clostridium tetanomorphum]|uniref:pyrroline-5-carboxylate reductase n=1 Tax=Clostridium tetanomorphum TaxID=1553 RepID=UPI0004522967|nr:pyrroline-5-carboxylate reductase [Clostridium tetanomorphum]KAJ49203.1 pyrroline-5-carboxylate reductase [Clostridium tetanomorphum DSM 665]KAJ51253.1 pyrroline-5-carboxylate reductase [Clostridium tetanomorphum DSM 665]MBP1864847.1 pyrroline-5-carboxylate reductase [Clostridium tetanomorphum]NRS84023.1 pyrroline-5-carboxylate reductase [Clostridium tetanomorphum]SQB92902.1 pyrroline-5-carboxylate reductase [Clostridium tetanomorphum]